jgi:hypothetical protein
MFGTGIGVGSGAGFAFSDFSNSDLLGLLRIVRVFLELLDQLFDRINLRRDLEGSAAFAARLHVQTGSDNTKRRDRRRSPAPRA